MSIDAFGGSGYWGNYTSAIGNGYQLNDLSYALADNASPYDSPEKTAAIGCFQKAINIAKARTDVQADIAWAADQDAQKREKQYWKQRQKNIAAGYIFG